MTEEILAQTIMTERKINLSWTIENFLHVLQSQSTMDPGIIYVRSFGTDDFLSMPSSMNGPDIIMPTQPKTTGKTFIDVERDDCYGTKYVFKAEPLKFPELQKKFEIEFVLSFQDTEGNILRTYKNAVYSSSSGYAIREIFAVKRSGFLSCSDSSATYANINSLLSDKNLMLKCCFRVIGCSTGSQAASENNLNCLLDGLKALYSSKPFSDFTIVVDDKVINVHKCILSSRSPVFAAMLEGETLETLNNKLVIEDFDFKTVETFISYLYTAQLRKLAVDEYFHLYSVSDKYELESLTKTCASKLIRSISVDNVCDVYALGYKHSDSALKTAAKAFLRENMSSVLGSESWRKLALENIQLAAELFKEAGIS